jgi:hypothetical protein
MEGVLEGCYAIYVLSSVVTISAWVFSAAALHLAASQRTSFAAMSAALCNSNVLSFSFVHMAALSRK